MSYICRNLLIRGACPQRHTPQNLVIMTQFKWTDESVKAFTQVYSSNFDSKCIPKWFRGSYSDYIGKKVDAKLEKFKSDWVRYQSEQGLVLCLEDREDLTLTVVDGKLLIKRA